VKCYFPFCYQLYVCVCLSSIYVFWLTLSRIFKPFFLNIYAKLYLFLKTNKWKQYFEGEIYKSEVKIPVISWRFFCMWSYPAGISGCVAVSMTEYNKDMLPTRASHGNTMASATWDVVALGLCVPRNILLRVVTSLSCIQSEGNFYCKCSDDSVQ
jgi:hypothetical protein